MVIQDYVKNQNIRRAYNILFFDKRNALYDLAYDNNTCLNNLKMNKVTFT